MMKMASSEMMASLPAERTASTFAQPVARHDRGTDRADGTGLVHRGNARDDRAQNGEDQRQRRHQDQHDRPKKLHVHLLAERHRRRHA